MKTALYVGLDAPMRSNVKVIHCPLIEVIPRPKDSPDIKDALAKLPEVTHVIVTSKTAATCLLELNIDPSKVFLSVGRKTSDALYWTKNVLTAQRECQEGICELIEELKLSSPLFFWGHSHIARSFITEQLHPLIECVLYETHYKAPARPIDMNTIDEIHFSSPSSVDAFFHFFGTPPSHIVLHSRGDETKKALNKKLS